MKRTKNISIFYKLKINYLISVLGLFDLLYFLKSGKETGNDATEFASAILIVSIIVNVFFANNINEDSTKKSTILTLILSLIFAIQLSISELFNAICVQQLSILMKIIVVFVIYINIFSIVNLLFHKVLKFNCDKEEKLSKKEYLNILLLIVLESLIFVLSTYPAICVQNDVSTVYYEATTGLWDNWHTLGYLLFVRLCTNIYESEYSVIIMQTVIWLILNAYIIDFLGNINSKIAKIYALLLCLSILPFYYLEWMVKDTVFSMGILAATAVIFKIIYFEKIDWKDILVFSTIPLFAILCRHGGAIVVFCSTMILLAWAVVKRNGNLIKGIAVTVLVHLCAFILVDVILMGSLGTLPNPKVIKYGMPMTTIGAAVQNGVEFDEEDTVILEQVMPLEEWGHCYNKYWADDISRLYGKIGENIVTVEVLLHNSNFGIDLLKINFKLLIHHPIIYCKAIFNMSSIVWEMAKPLDAPNNTIYGLAEDENITYRTAYNITNRLTQFIGRNPISMALLTRGGFALFVIMFCIVLIFYKKNYHMLICFIPIFICNAMLVITIPAQDPRYILPTIETAIIAVPIALVCKNKNTIKDFREIKWIK